MKDDGVPEFSDLSDLNRRIGDRVRGERESKGWTQGTLGAKVDGYVAGAGSQGTVSRLELGERSPRVDEAYALAMIFKVPIGELLGIVRPPTRNPAQMAEELAAVLRAVEKRKPFYYI